jgi:hypothetical protein
MKTQSPEEREREKKATKEFLLGFFKALDSISGVNLAGSGFRFN